MFHRALRLELHSAVGLTLIELLFTIAVFSIAAAISMAATRDALDELRTAMAARYLAGRVMQARIEAVRRSACIALRFEPTTDDYRFASFRDGNGNGIRAADIRAGIDVPLSGFEQMRDKFAGIRFGLMTGLPDVDGSPATGGDGVRIGTARILTMSPDGTATAGTLYLRSRRGQYAVRVLGATGRVRVLQYRPGDGTWVTR
jgi:prepilin-type N-terminal cleavage/methylation domain-containing protein